MVSPLATAAHEVLQNVSFSVERHEILAIVGRNGVGKTTLMKTLIGLLRLMDGRIEFKGENIGRFRPSRRADRGVAYVPQGRGIFNRMSVTENLLLGQGLGGQSRKANFDRVYRFFPAPKGTRITESGLDERWRAAAARHRPGLGRAPGTHSAGRALGGDPAPTSCRKSVR